MQGNNLNKGKTQLSLAVGRNDNLEEIRNLARKIYYLNREAERTKCWIISREHSDALLEQICNPGGTDLRG